MGKRIFRLSAAEAFNRSEELLNRNISFVMINGRVHIGILKKADHEFFHCLDMSKHTFQIRLKDLNEVIYDMTSNF